MSVRTRLALLVLLAAAVGAGRTVGAQQAREIRIEIIGALVEHRLSTGLEPQREFGSAFGAAIWSPVMSWIELRGELLGGALAAQTPDTDDRRFGELDLAAMVIPFPWLAFEVGGGSRTYTGPLGRQRWVAMRAGGEIRLVFGNGRMRGTLGGALVPVVVVSGVESPSVAAQARSGISYRHGELSASVVYEIERYDFPMTGGTRRLEQLSSLSARVGVLLPELAWPGR